MRSLTRRLLAGTSATSLALAPLPGAANPVGGQVVGGSASIQGQGTANVTVNQSTNRAVIDWRTFNIAPGETTQFVQPGPSSVTLNRVTGGLGVSTIDGTIKANGGVYIVNPDGLLFGPSAKINVGSFLGTTHDIANSDFMAGSNAFTISGNPSASIVNQGSITAAKGGFAALVAPGVRNDGVITANLGSVALASGNAFTLDMYGDSLIKLQAGDSIAGSVRDVATGQTLKSLVTNTGTLKANGGKVALTAVAARKVVDSVINSSGVVEANTVGTRKGLVVFRAATADSKPAGAPVQTVKVSGKIKTAGRKAGTTGGKIQITGENIQLVNAKLNASGKAGGGTILVGGDFKGGDPTAPAVTLLGQSFESTAVPNATNVSVDAASVLNASAVTYGNGGKIVVWSNMNTAFAGSILATGGSQSGNGGFAEVSGKQDVNFTGIKVGLGSPTGRPGTILFDPDVENIDQIAANTLSALLNGSSTSSNGDSHLSSSGGTVVVAADTIKILNNVDILKTAGGDATLALFATAGINIGANVVIGSSAGALNLYMDADASNASLFPAAVPVPTSIAQTESVITAANGLAVSDFYPYGFPGLNYEPPNIPNRSGQSLLTALESTNPQFITDFSSAYQNLQLAKITTDPTARFYLNGGKLTAFGNDYVIAQTLTDSAVINDPNTVVQNAFLTSVTASLCAGTPCGTAAYGQSIFPISFDSNGNVTQYSQGYYIALAEILQRNQTAIPTGVFSNDPIPGLVVPSTPLVGSGAKTYTFSDLVKLAADEGITSLEAFQWENSLKGSDLNAKTFTAFDASAATSSIGGIFSGIEANHPELVGPISAAYGFISKIPILEKWTDAVETVMNVANFSIGDQIELSLAMQYRPSALVLSMINALVAGILDEASGTVLNSAQISAYVINNVGSNPTAAEVQKQIAALQVKVSSYIRGNKDAFRQSIFNNVKH